MSVYTAKEIMEIIPHRYPFLLIDTIEEIEPGVRGVKFQALGIFNGKHHNSLPEGCILVFKINQGHFPQNPVMPGVLIIEALAQVGAVAMLSQESFQGKTAYFAGIQNARFREKILPGDVLMLETEIIKVKGPIGVGKAVAKVNGKKAVEAELTFAIS